MDNNPANVRNLTADQIRIIELENELLATRALHGEEVLRREDIQEELEELRLVHRRIIQFHWEDLGRVEAAATIQRRMIMAENRDLRRDFEAYRQHHDANLQRVRLAGEMAAARDREELQDQYDYIQQLENRVRVLERGHAGRAPRVVRQERRVRHEAAPERARRMIRPARGGPVPNAALGPYQGGRLALRAVEENDALGAVNHALAMVDAQRFLAAAQALALAPAPQGNLRNDFRLVLDQFHALDGLGQLAHVALLGRGFN